MRGGRKLRCATCKHTWFQDETSDNAEGENFAATLKARTQRPESDETEKVSFLEKIKNDFVFGYKIIALTFLLVIAGFAIYKFITPTVIMGVGLAFDNITLERNGENLIMNGEIVNAMDGDRGVPPIQITKIFANDVMGDTIIISPERKILHSGETMLITANIDEAGNEVVNLSVTFKSDTLANVTQENHNNESDNNDAVDTHHEGDTHY